MYKPQFCETEEYRLHERLYDEALTTPISDERAEQLLGLVDYKMELKLDTSRHDPEKVKGKWDYYRVSFFHTVLVGSIVVLANSRQHAYMIGVDIKKKMGVDVSRLSVKHIGTAGLRKFDDNPEAFLGSTVVRFNPKTTSWKKFSSEFIRLTNIKPAYGDENPYVLGDAIDRESRGDRGCRTYRGHTMGECVRFDKTRRRAAGGTMSDRHIPSDLRI